MRILVLGSKGQLGRCLSDQLTKTHYEVFHTAREEIDIVDFDQAKKKIIEIDPDVLINASAYTAVDKAEEETDKADLINNLAVKNIADICNHLDCWFIHISTDYVFDGNSRIPYIEKDKTNPQGVYGLTKLNGEIAIKSSGCKHIIIRTAWVFSEYGNNFLKTMLKLRENHNELNVVCDQIGCPTYAQDIAAAIVLIIPQLSSVNDSGIYHFCGSRSCSWFNFAKEIFDISDKLNARDPILLNPIKTKEYPTLALRPMFSVLDCTKINRKFNIKTQNSYRVIEPIIQDLLKNPDL